MSLNMTMIKSHAPHNQFLHLWARAINNALHKRCLRLWTSVPKEILRLTHVRLWVTTLMLFSSADVPHVTYQAAVSLLLTPLIAFIKSWLRLTLVLRKSLRMNSSLYLILQNLNRSKMLAINQVTRHWWLPVSWLVQLHELLKQHDPLTGVLL